MRDVFKLVQIILQKSLKLGHVRIILDLQGSGHCETSAADRRVSALALLSLVDVGAVSETNFSDASWIQDLHKCAKTLFNDDRVSMMGSTPVSRKTPRALLVAEPIPSTELKNSSAR